MTGTVHDAGEAAAGAAPGSAVPAAAPGTAWHERRQKLVGWAVVIVVALVAALLIRAFAVQAFWVPTQSMEPTLVPYDRLLVNKLSYDLHPVHDGDVVVFRRPPSDHSTVGDLIKRVIAGPGQWLRVTGCKVYVDDRLQSQPYLPKGWQDPSSEYCTLWDLPGMLNLPDPYQVPPGDYFVMGDNRTDSEDSRYWAPCPGATSSAGLLFGFGRSAGSAPCRKARAGRWPLGRGQGPPGAGEPVAPQRRCPDRA